LRWAVPVVAAAVAATGTACGLGDKQAIADRLHASRQAVADASPAAGTLTYELRASGSDAPGADGAQLAALTGATGAATTSVQVVLDGRDRHARVSVPAIEGAVERTTVFADTELLVRRQNARATERRTWARLDLERIVEDERPLTLREMTPAAVLDAVASTINPVYLVELVEGTLAGSVERKGQETIGDVAVIRYEANISFDKAMTGLDFDDEEREVRLRLFRLLGATADVVPAELWIDAEGRLRRLRVDLDQRVDRQRSNDLAVTLELTAFGDATSLEGPPAEAVVTYERFGRLVRSALPAEA
jgi:hypothetical protein